MTHDEARTRVGDITTTDLGDRWHVVLYLGNGREVQAWIPKTADTIDLVNFADHLRDIARRGVE